MGPKPILINGVKWVAPRNGRKEMGFTGVISSRICGVIYFNLLGTGCLGPTLYHDQPTTLRIICQMAGPLNASRLWRAVMLAWVSKALGQTSVLASSFFGNPW